MSAITEAASKLDPIALANPISPSQTETYELCQRKWGIYKLDGVKGRSNKFSDRGTDAHLVLELWLRDGKEIDTKSHVGKIIAPGTKFLPAPKTGLAEGDFQFDTDRVRFLGKIDWRNDPQEKLVTLRTRKTKLYVVRVIDHKTTTNIAKWAKRVFVEDKKTKERTYVLINNPQTVFYGVRAIALSPDPDNTIAELDWIYYQDTPDKPKAEQISVHVVPDEIYEEYVAARSLSDIFGVITHTQLLAAFAKKEEVALEMHEHHRAGRKGNDLPFDIRGCWAFGGCSYLGKECKLTSRERLKARMAQENAGAGKMSLKERIAKQNASKGKAEPENKESAAPASDIKAKLAARKAAQTAGNGAAAAAVHPGTNVNPPESKRTRPPEEELEDDTTESAEDTVAHSRSQAQAAGKATPAEHAAASMIEAAIQLLENAKKALS